MQSSVVRKSVKRPERIKEFGEMIKGSQIFGNGKVRNKHDGTTDRRA